MRLIQSSIIFACVAAAAMLSPAVASAHCDGMDGPVVMDAQKALESGNVNLVLIWIRKQDEPEIIQAFNKTLAVRKLSSEAKELADLYFFETLVRVHRESEGAPYTGLKPAGRDLGPVIPAADRAIETGSAKQLVDLLTREVHHGVEEHFRQVLTSRHFRQHDVEKGRAYVAAYVEFVHYVERIHQASTSPAHAHQH